MYDYFTQLTVESDKKLWLLVDPVEDDPKHKWSEFAQWYKHCIAAMLLMDDVDSYEIMPWPDRIFLPGYGTGGGTPARFWSPAATTPAPAPRTSPRRAR